MVPLYNWSLRKLVCLASDLRLLSWLASNLRQFPCWPPIWDGPPGFAYDKRWFKWLASDLSRFPLLASDLRWFSW